MNLKRQNRLLPERMKSQHGDRSSGIVRERGRTSLEIPEGTQVVVRSALRRVNSWLTPSNWSGIDWQQEIAAVATAAACQAGQDFDPARQVPVASFIYQRVIARALTRYRQEWRYAIRCALAPAEIVEQTAAPVQAPFRATYPVELLHRVLDQLPEPQHWLLEQLFWLHRTETSIAAQLHISQPAVCKRKRAALLHSRVLLRAAAK